ncbi:MAG: hypothetical protein NTW16_16125 [Bacteroidetes bacterium]|nr:hypothetical protein [Bacteroidota bacterium]
MKELIYPFLFVLLLSLPAKSQVSVNVNGAAAHSSAMLDVTSSSMGFLPPRMSTSQRDAISSPATGLVIFNTDLKCLEFYAGPPDGWYCPCVGAGDPGCWSVDVGGTYRTGLALDPTNVVSLMIDVLVPGGYQIVTGQVNGYWFSGRGTFNSTGNHQVLLYGRGTPENTGTDDFSFSFGSNVCYFQVTVQSAPQPQLFRSGIFLHHSTGGNIWGPNGSSTSVPQEMTVYNTAHGYSGLQGVAMNETWWSPSDNEWVTQHQFFEDPDPYTGIGYYLPDNKVIVIKSCFPSSAISGPGQASDTLNPWLKTVWNYKWHWRHIVKAMASHPDNFFAIWTNAPLEPYSTNSAEAMYSRQFCIWAKDTLATGLDPVYGSFPPNVYVFDFFQKLTGPDGMMLSSYAVTPGDSHPNAPATALVAPQFVQEIFDAAISYEATFPPLTGKKDHDDLPGTKK